ncbi:MAG TPA: type VII secretion target [Actinopolymorphaceae bacterium]|jgi:hypothetical protein
MAFHHAIGELRDAASAADSAAEQVASIKLSAALADAGDGMPGSRSVAAIDNVGKAWKRQIDGWIRQANDYAAALRKAADNYEKNEEAAARDLGGHG